MRFTDQGIRSLPFTEKGQRYYRDEAVLGLELCVGTRTKSFTVIVRKGDDRRRVTLGKYDPPIFTLALAREKARDVLAEERLKKTQGTRTTFREAFELYDRTHLSTLRPGSSRNVRRALSDEFGPKLDKRILSEITRADIAPILDTMTHIPAAMVSNYRYLRAFLNWCVGRGYIDTAPTDRMQGPKAVESRSRVLAADELVSIWNNTPQSDYGRIVKLCLLSAQRKHQWAAVRREYIQGDQITWPASLMKMGKVHTLPLTPTMKTLLPDRIGYLFPNSSGTPFDNWSRNKSRLDWLSEVQGWRLHDLRRTWATTAAEELGVDPHIIETVLAHATGSAVARTYNRALYIEPMRKALTAYEERLKALLSTTEDTKCLTPISPTSSLASASG